MTKKEAYEIGCKDSFAEVLHQSDDQVTVKNLLMSQVPVDVQIEITALYNLERVQRQIRSEKLSNT